MQNLKSLTKSAAKGFLDYLAAENIKQNNKILDMKNLIFGTFIMIIACHAGYAQCNEEMYELALAQVGKDVVLVRDFKVKLNEGNKHVPVERRKQRR